MKMRNKYIAAFFIIFTLQIVSPATHAANPCADGAGVPVHDLETGIGGTGHRPPIGGDGDSGIGGTGAASPEGHRHIKDAYYVTGTIYAYGSICVNGLRITYTPQTPIKLGNMQKTPTDLHLGQVVEVEAYLDPSRQLRARSISLDYSLQGPVTFVSPGTRHIRVMNETILVNNIHDFKEIQTGDTVYVSGLRDPEGRTVATLIKKMDASSPSFIYGSLRQTSDTTVDIGSTPVVLQDSLLQNAPNTGVIATGVWNGHRLQVETLTPLVEEPYVAGYASLEGYIEESGARDVSVICHEKFTTDKLPKNSFAQGDRVIVTGRVTSNGKMEARQLYHALPRTTRIEGF